MPLSQESLDAVLGLRPFRFFPQIDSTNDHARAWLLEGAPAGAVVIADEQTTGRGRFQRTWNAPPGTAILMSVILRPEVAPSKLGRATMVGAVSVAEALATVPSLPMEMIGLKYPNDVLLVGRKVAGILAEAVWEGDRLVGVVLGIGLNVRIDFTGTALATAATSIERVTGVSIHRTDLADRLLKRVDHWAARIGERSLFNAWRGRLTTLGQRVSVRLSGDDTWAIQGLAQDVDEEGALIVRDDSGADHRIIAGDVTL